MMKPPLPSIFRKKANHGKQDGAVTESDAITAPRVVSPKKKHGDDPDLVYYQSESSLSTLSLNTDDYHSTDEEYYTSQQKRPSKKASHRRTGSDVSNASSDAESELSQVIAGVRKLNRTTSGKITPLNKRRRRRRRGSRSGSRSVGSADDNYSFSSGLSSHGSLLDEVIEEEGEFLNLSNEGGIEKKKSAVVIPVMVIDASPSPKKKRGKDRNGSKSRSTGSGGSGRKKGGADENSNVKYLSLKDEEASPPGNDDEGYDSGYHAVAPPTNIIQSAAAYSNVILLSDAEESFSSRAARARRNRILSKRNKSKQHPEDPDGLVIKAAPSYAASLSPEEFPDDEPLIKSLQQKKQLDSDKEIINHHSPLSSAAASNGGNSDDRSDCSPNTAAWQARKVRMARLRMNRSSSAAAVATVKSSSNSTNPGVVDNTQNTTIAAGENENVIRAQSGIVLACSSDEDSI